MTIPIPVYIHWVDVWDPYPDAWRLVGFFGYGRAECLGKVGCWDVEYKHCKYTKWLELFRLPTGHFVKLVVMRSEDSNACRARGILINPAQAIAWLRKHKIRVPDGLLASAQEKARSSINGSTLPASVYGDEKFMWRAWIIEILLRNHGIPVEELLAGSGLIDFTSGTPATAGEEEKYPEPPRPTRDLRSSPSQAIDRAGQECSAEEKGNQQLERIEQKRSDSELKIATFSGRKTRALLEALAGKDNVPIATLLRALYGADDSGNLGALLKLVTRTNRRLTEEETRKEIKKEGETLVLRTI